MGILDKAIKSLAPESSFTTDGKKITEWISIEIAQPTEAAIQAEVTHLQAEYAATEYQRQRVAEYPPIGDQLDALWKGGDAAAEMLAKVQAVKNKYPKGAA
jgi:hypothetical protein